MLFVIFKKITLAFIHYLVFSKRLFCKNECNNYKCSEQNKKLNAIQERKAVEYVTYYPNDFFIGIVMVCFETNVGFACLCGNDKCFFWYWMNLMLWCLYFSVFVMFCNYHWFDVNVYVLNAVLLVLFQATIGCCFHSLSGVSYVCKNGFVFVSDLLPWFISWPNIWLSSS